MANGGIIGPDNKTSRGKNKVTKQTSSGTITTQPGTRLANVLVVAGGGGGGYSGGGGAGGLRTIASHPVDGNTGYPVTVGAGGTGAPVPGGAVAPSGSDSVGFGITSDGGGGGGHYDASPPRDGTTGGFRS